MRKGKLEALPIDRREELGQALNRINLLAGIGTTIKKNRDEEKRLSDLIIASTRTFGERGVTAPDGYYFAITAGGNIFELSEDEGDWWSEDKSKQLTDYGKDRDYVFIAGLISNMSGVHSHESPAAAYAYSPDGRTRCLINDASYKVDIVAQDELPELLVNPQSLTEVVTS